MNKEYWSISELARIGNVAKSTIQRGIKSLDIVPDKIDGGSSGGFKHYFAKEKSLLILKKVRGDLDFSDLTEFANKDEIGEPENVSSIAEIVDLEATESATQTAPDQTDPPPNRTDRPNDPEPNQTDPEPNQTESSNTSLMILASQLKKCEDTLEYERKLFDEARAELRDTKQKLDEKEQKLDEARAEIDRLNRLLYENKNASEVDNTESTPEKTITEGKKHKFLIWEW